MKTLSKLLIAALFLCHQDAVYAEPNAGIKIMDSWNHQQASITDQFELLLTAFAALDEELISESDASIAVELNISPPAETQLPAGVAPSEIHDPSLRAEYAAALAANQKRAERSSYQHKLRQSESQAESRLNDLVTKATPQQLRRMSQTLRRSKLSPKRKTQVAALIANATVQK